jgi:hypothetical protein
MTRPYRPTARDSILPGLALALALLGALLGALAVGAYLDGRSDRARYALVAGLPDLASARPGELGVLEGRIAAGARPLDERFVAYLREEYRRRGWRAAGGLIQPLPVDAPGGGARVVNDDYRFDPVLGAWHHEEREVSAPGWTVGSVRHRGLVAGMPVMVVGRVAAGDAPADAPRRVVAESVAGVDRATYLRLVARGIVRTRAMAAWMSAAALACIGIGGWGVLRALR